MLDFACVDVETANWDRESICQVGLVTVKNGSIVDTWNTLVNPEDWFDGWNVKLHGISEEMVSDAPTFPQIRDELYRRMADLIVVSHTSFDRVAIEWAAEKYDLDPPQATWLDSARIARRAWPDRYARAGYGLKTVASDLGITFKHHDALEDARAAVEIVLRACDETGLDIDGWMKRVKQSIFPSTNSTNTIPDANIEGPMYGEHIVFTGALIVPRRDAAEWAAKMGCQVHGNVNKKTTMLVVGVQDKEKLVGGYDKSTKHRKAEDLIAKGHSIQILSEKDFLGVIVKTDMLGNLSAEAAEKAVAIAKTKADS